MRAFASSGNTAAAASNVRYQAVPIDSPPPPQEQVTERHYVPFEVDSFRQARDWAAEQVVRKYPGATDIVAFEDKLIEQYLAGKRKS